MLRIIDVKHVHDDHQLRAQNYVCKTHPSSPAICSEYYTCKMRPSSPNIRGVIKKFWAQNAWRDSLNFKKSVSVGHLILLKDIGSVKSMRSRLVAFVKHF